MVKIRLFFIFAAIGFSSIAYSFRLPVDYVDGQSLCRARLADDTSEIGKWIDVPAYYKTTSAVQTQIYYYMKKKFNPKLQTLIYFIGGPGAATRGYEFDLPNTNIIFFDQRGVACSLPPTRAMFLDPQFYSSEAIANDALMILNDLQVEKVAVYGHSYGTVPATIFASKYADRTLSLILEGVIFKADESLWVPQGKINLMQEFYDSLSEQQKNLIIKVSRRDDIPKNWFSFMARTAMAIGNFKNGMYEFLNQSVFSADINDENALSTFAKMMTDFVPKVDLTTPAESFTYSDVMRAMVACQELGMSQPEFSHFLNFENGRFVPDRNNIDNQSNCVPLGLDLNKAQPYTAEKYPVTVPVTYFLGAHDPMTSLEQGLRHFQNAASVQKQVLIMLEGGHNPNLDMLMKFRHCHYKNGTFDFCEKDEQLLMQIELFEKAVVGGYISEAEIEQYNSNGPNRWKNLN